MKYRSSLILILWSWSAIAQSPDSLVLGFREYLGYVKKYHPVVKQAQLKLDGASAAVMSARGGFDPKIEVDYDRKRFKGTEYYELLNSTFKIPTWYGIELKGTFEQNEGSFLNPQNAIPENGLYSAGVSFSLGQDFLINDRMATLKQAKLFELKTELERRLLVNQLVFDASLAYFDWLKSYQEVEVFQTIQENARVRLAGVKRSAEAGDIPIIDTVEARITYQDRSLNLEQAKLNFVKRTLQLSNFLWIENNIPLEVQPGVIPDKAVFDEVDFVLNLDEWQLQEFLIDAHPKVKAKQYQIDGLEVEKKLKANKLLPVIDINYNFLTQEPLEINTFRPEQYKGWVRFAFPLFLRKERGELKIARYKLQDADFELKNTRLELQNKIAALDNEIRSLDRQFNIISGIVSDYRVLLSAESRKFEFGESSLFLVNSREQKYIENSLKQIEIENKFLSSKAALFNTMAAGVDDLP